MILNSFNSFILFSLLVFITILNSCTRLDDQFIKLKNNPVEKSLERFCEHPDSIKDHELLKKYPELGICLFNACNDTSDANYYLYQKYQRHIETLSSQTKELSQIFHDEKYCNGPIPPEKKCLADKELDPIICDGTSKTNCALGSCRFEICPEQMNDNNKRYQGILQYLKSDEKSIVVAHSDLCVNGCKNTFADTFNLSFDNDNGSCSFTICNQPGYLSFASEEPKRKAIALYNSFHHSIKTPIGSDTLLPELMGVYLGNISFSCTGGQYGCTTKEWLDNGTLPSSFPSYVKSYQAGLIDKAPGLCQFNKACIDPKFVGYHKNKVYNDEALKNYRAYQQKFTTFNQDNILNDALTCGKKVGCIHPDASNKNSPIEEYEDLADQLQCKFKGCFSPNTENFNQAYLDRILSYFKVTSLDQLPDKYKSSVVFDTASCGKSLACMHPQALPPKQSDATLYTENKSCKFSVCCDPKFKLFIDQKNLRLEIARYNSLHNIAGPKGDTSCGSELSNVSHNNLVKQCSGELVGCTTKSFIGKELPKDFANYVRNFASQDNIYDDGKQCSFLEGCIDDTKANFYKNGKTSFNTGLKTAYSAYKGLFPSFSSTQVLSQCGTMLDGCTNSHAKNKLDPSLYEDVRNSCRFEFCATPGTENFQRDFLVRQAAYSYFGKILGKTISDISEIPAPYNTQVQALSCGKVLGCTHPLASNNPDVNKLEDGSCTFADVCTNPNNENSSSASNLDKIQKIISYNNQYNPSKTPKGTGTDSYGVLFKNVFIGNVSLNCGSGREYGCTSDEYFDATKVPGGEILGEKAEFINITTNYTAGRVDDPIGTGLPGKCIFKNSCDDISYLEYDVKYSNFLKNYLKLYPNHLQKYSSLPNKANCKTLKMSLPIVDNGNIKPVSVVMLIDDSSSFDNNKELIQNALSSLGEILLNYDAISVKLFTFSSVNSLYTNAPNGLNAVLCPNNFPTIQFSMPKPFATIQIQSNWTSQEIQDQLLLYFNQIKTNSSYAVENGLCLISRFFNDYKKQANSSPNSQELVSLILVTDEEDASQFTSSSYNQTYLNSASIANPSLSPICFDTVKAPEGSVLTKSVPAYGVNLGYDRLFINYDCGYTTNGVPERLKFNFNFLYQQELAYATSFTENVLESKNGSIKNAILAINASNLNQTSYTVSCEDLRLAGINIDSYIKLINSYYIAPPSPKNIPCTVTYTKEVLPTTTISNCSTALAIYEGSPTFAMVKSAISFATNSPSECTPELENYLTNSKPFLAGKCEMRRSNEKIMGLIIPTSEGNPCEDICEGVLRTYPNGKQYSCIQEYVNSLSTSSSLINKHSYNQSCSVVETTKNYYNYQELSCVQSNNNQFQYNTLSDTSTLFTQDLAINGSKYSSQNMNFLFVVPQNISQQGSQYCDSSSSQGSRYITLHNFLSSKGVSSAVADICNPNISDQFSTMLEDKILALLKGARYQIHKGLPLPTIQPPVILKKLDQQGNVLEEYEVPNENYKISISGDTVYLQFKPVDFVKKVIPQYQFIELQLIKN